MQGYMSHVAKREGQGEEGRERRKGGEGEGEGGEGWSIKCSMYLQMGCLWEGRTGGWVGGREG